jgi:hypothetical protein
MSDLWGNDYSHAGKGAKARKRLRIEEIPKKLNVRKAKPYLQTPTNENVAKERETIAITARGLKVRIRRLTCQCEHRSEVWKELQRANYPGSAVLVSGVRNEMLDCIKIMIEEGLIDPDDLAQYRRQFKKKQRKARSE